MDIKRPFAVSTTIYKGSVFIDPLPPTLPLSALLLLAAKVAVKRYFHPKG